MAKRWKKLAAIAVSAVLATSMVFGLAACGEKKPGSDNPGENVEPNPGPNPGPNPVSGSYTYNATYSASPTTWNPHTWESNTDSIILGYITMGFYEVQLTYGTDGKPNGQYEWVPEMAAAFPLDVTSSYVGKYGVKAGDKGKAWEIALNEKACWEDGTPIKADDYVYSMQQQLDPEMLNRRSDSYTGGTFTVVGAKNYLYGGHLGKVDNMISEAYGDDEYVLFDDFTVDADGYLKKTVDGVDCFIVLDINDGGNWGSTSLKKYYDNYGAAVFGDAWEGVEAKADEGGLVKLTKADAEVICDMIAVLHGYEDAAEYAEDAGDYAYLEWEEFCYYGKVFDKIAWEGNVGLEKTGDYKIVIVLQDEISEFNLKYNLSSTWLVNKDLYEKNKVPATGAGTLVSSTYCTTLASTISYGPYKLESYKLDTDFKLVKNDKWYGYTDGKHEGQFQTTAVYYRMVSGSDAHETNKMLFLKGEIDDLGLLAAEVPTYNSSKYFEITPGSYTFQFFLCSNLSWLESESNDTENHSVLSLDTFRKAISYSISRQAYCQSYSPASQPGFGVLNYLYVIDPDTGALYRDTDAAKKTSVKYAGFEEQADGSWKCTYKDLTFADLDEAYDALTGYDPEYAAQLFEEAYAEAKAAGLYTDGQKVVINYGNPGELSANATAMLASFNEMFADALKYCKGSTFAGVEIKPDTSYANENAYWEALKAGKMDLSFSAWGGSAMDPWGIIFSCYIDPANSNNYGFDKLSKTIDITVDVSKVSTKASGVGNTLTASLYDWASWLNNGQGSADFDKNNIFQLLGVAVGDADIDFKVEVLAACELAQLETTVNVPIYYQYENGLRSAKYNNGYESYINSLIGRGGLRHVTYNYTDDEWTAFVAAQGGNLDTYYQ